MLEEIGSLTYRYSMKPNATRCNQVHGDGITIKKCSRLSKRATGGCFQVPFFSLDPSLAELAFRRAVALYPTSAKAGEFIALED